MNLTTIRAKIWGDYCCCSRPEFKVERVSYPMITPSAARGVLEAIYWKPEFRYQIRRIGVLSLGSQTAILRNELDRRQGNSPFFIEDARQQRSSLILKNVAYILEADIIPLPHAYESENTTNPLEKYKSCFERRLKNGQCFQTPYLGTREFAAYFAPVEENDVPNPELNQDLGLMLLDIAFVESKRGELDFKRPGREKPVSGHAQAMFFEARLREGWLEVPSEKYRELYELEGSHV
jgi:CRISPR-associated protein Cas5d